ncbi:MAG: DNA cytosine methyltransferase [candidate division Zixibacteria bacterium]|nr:DNA cytosine methyltransferase [candidate division Zixibacteria bacterium]
MNWLQKPSGLIIPESYCKPSRPMAIDLFSGAGGMSLGYIQAGFEVIAGLDNNFHATLTYLTNLGNYPMEIHFIEPDDKIQFEKALNREYKKSKGETLISSFPVTGSGWISKQPAGTPGISHFFFGDVKKITGDEILDTIGIEKGELDCVMGGPPCQGFTLAGKRNVMDPRNSYVFDFIRLVLEMQPKTMLFENVPGITSMVTPEGLPIISAMCLALEEGGWGNYKSLLRALNYQAGSGALLRERKSLNKLKKVESKQRKLFEKKGK